MFTPFDSYFLNQAERPRTRAEQLAADQRAAELVASLARGQSAVRRAVSAAVRRDWARSTRFER
jgi:hypothetical protein